ncbi:MAG TPA: hypothetical protein VML55_21390 [Planctomycetaceae bacterium]|nr:hypothetical protein [Planctomycetaceae bacterium]
MSWQTIKQKLSHAFAVEPPGAAEPTEPERAAVERVCREVVRRHLTTPALAFLQMSQPLNYLASQAMHFFLPIVSAVVDTEGARHFAEFLEHRGSIEYICRRLEALEDEAKVRERQDTARLEPDALNHGDTETRRK